MFFLINALVDIKDKAILPKFDVWINILSYNFRKK